MSDEELSRALSTVREAARTEGHRKAMVESPRELCALAQRHAGRNPAREAGVRAVEEAPGGV